VGLSFLLMVYRSGAVKQLIHHLPFYCWSV
jgi:hypothetical protein